MSEIPEIKSVKRGTKKCKIIKENRQTVRLAHVWGFHRSIGSTTERYNVITFPEKRNKTFFQIHSNEQEFIHSSIRSQSALIHSCVFYNGYSTPPPPFHVVVFFVATREQIFTRVQSIFHEIVMNTKYGTVLFSWINFVDLFVFFSRVNAIHGEKILTINYSWITNIDIISSTINNILLDQQHIISIAPLI